MDERQRIESAFHAFSVVGEGLTTTTLLTAFYAYEKVSAQLKEASPLHIAAGGQGMLTAPGRCTIDTLPMCLLITTDQGGIRVGANGETASLSEGEACLVSLKEGGVDISTALLPWSYRIYLISGRDLDLYVPYMKGIITTSNLKTGSIFLSAFSQADRDPGDADYLNIHQNLTFLLTEAVLPALDPLRLAHALPDYLVKMHEFVLDPKGRPFSLKNFENEFGISRYRLCREYSRSFGISPLKDFNNTRMHEARNLLISTDDQIQEISNQVGFENVTHFINLFKQAYSMTPGEYRRMTRGKE